MIFYENCILYCMNFGIVAVKKIFLIHNVAESRVKFHSFFMPLLTLFWDGKETIIKKCIKKANFFCGYPLSCGLIHIHAWRHIKAIQRSGEYVSCSRHQCLLIIYCSYFHVTPVCCIYFSFFSLDMYDSTPVCFHTNKNLHVWAYWMRIEWNVARHRAGKQKVNNLAAYKWCFLYVLIFQVPTEKEANNKLRKSLHGDGWSAFFV